MKRTSMSIFRAILKSIKIRYEMYMVPLEERNKEDSIARNSRFTLSDQDNISECVDFIVLNLRKVLNVESSTSQNKRESKLKLTNDEKESLLECAFMVRVVFGGIEYHRYMDITDQKAKMEAAFECLYFLEKVKLNHLRTRFGDLKD